MTRLLLALVLVSGPAAAFADNHDEAMGPSCYNFMALSEADRMASVEELVAGGTVTEELALEAFNACETDPNASVGEVLQSMADG